MSFSSTSLVSYTESKTTFKESIQKIYEEPDFEVKTYQMIDLDNNYIYIDLNTESESDANTDHLNQSSGIYLEI